VANADGYFITTKALFWRNRAPTQAIYQTVRVSRPIPFVLGFRLMSKWFRPLRTDQSVGAKGQASATG